MAIVECGKPELQLFEPKAIQYSVTESDEVALKPLAAITGSNFIQFSHAGYGDFYKDISSIYLVLRVKMNHKQEDGTEIKTAFTDTKALNVAPVNNLLHSLFKNITFTLNGVQCGNNQNYAYKAYFENLINFDSSTAGQHLSGVIFKPDTPGHFNDVREGNQGASERALLFQPDEEVELVGKLHLDMLNQPKYILNNVDIGLTLELHKDTFYLQKQTLLNPSSLTILDATLYFNQIKLNPEVSLAHQRILESGKSATYPYKRREVRNYLITTQSTSFSWDNVCNGTKPETILIAFVENSGYLGSYRKNPYCFEHFNLQSFAIKVNGFEIAPRNLKFDFSQNNPLNQHAYFSLFRQLNLHQSSRANIIDPKFFNNGGFILAYDLTPDKSTDCANFPTSGAIRIEGTFSSGLQAPVTVLAYLIFDADLVIDKDRNVYATNV